MQVTVDVADGTQSVFPGDKVRFELGDEGTLHIVEATDGGGFNRRGVFARGYWLSAAVEASDG